jgi:exonuclease III
MKLVVAQGFHRRYNDCLKEEDIEINGIASDTKFRMLEELIRRQEIDIVLLQEVVNHTLKTMSGYHTHTNVGTDQRGTALVIKEGIHVKEIKDYP